MPPEATERRLAAIMFTDIVGYTTLMAESEAKGLRVRTRHRQVVRPLVERYHGEWVESPGDQTLSTFPSALDAVKCALAIQEQLKDDADLKLHLGIHSGDIVLQGGEVSGDGVNVASRICALSQDGGLCVSGEVYQSVRNQPDVEARSLGEQELKNVGRPVAVYALGRPGTVAGPPRAARSRFWNRGRSVVAALALAVVALVVWRIWDRVVIPPGSAGAEGDTMLALPRGPGIAVLPFTNMSGDPEQEFFADGLTEDILTGLSRFSELRVIGRNTTFRYKDQPVDIRALGGELGVRYVLEGSVRRSAGEIRVTAQLLDASTDSHLWAETYDRELTAVNLFAIQDDIRGKVVTAIAGSFGIIARAGLEEGRGRRTESLDAYECVLRAHAYAALHTEAKHLEAVSCLERAVEVDPGYADAWAQLAYVYREEYHHNFNPQAGDALDRSLASARRALELDPTNQPAHWALHLSHFSRGELDASFAAGERALALNPSQTRVVASIALSLTYAGRGDRGVALMEKAIALSPYHPGWFYLAPFYDHYRKGLYEEALADARKINMPELWDSYAALAQANGQLGRREHAAAAVAELMKVYPDFPANAWEEFRKRNLPEQDIAHLVDGLRKAGLHVPEPSR